ncbi:helix-turn-helix transcriptional regulator [Amycolatopsis jiangsuensis]|uniref:AraC-like DNA-binding protein n=1 Tax=Amycolatopsis jiangsuensis TaxID=1181879 RepID=A0A840J0C0_9PSEU|nr:helix-turn-helix transcriptional regulator [Amycolatopsis jiangsuensis]MBB4688396.1 AraC-like DNA-binding protein [Amycolatopsis jiangsuensis]
MREAVLEAARFLAAGATTELRLGDVADHVGYSPFHLARAFERQVGMPPGKFLAAQRFQLAKRLLLESDEKVVDVCNAVGFCAAGTFTTRFTAAVGIGPQQFRMLPKLLGDHPPRPVHVPGPIAGGGVVTGRAWLSPAAVMALDGAPAVYVGLFPRQAAQGVPVSGALLDERQEFTLAGAPPGSYRLMACALPARGSPRDQLVPPVQVVGVHPEPVWIRPRPAAPQRRTVRLDLAPPWTPPVLVALPPLASAEAQERRRSR